MTRWFLCYNIHMNKRGFTLVELLVTISIFVVLTGVVLFSQNSFNSSILLTNLAYDTALTIRQAQTYGINIKNFNSTGSGNGVFVPYGVHFDMGAKQSFILFADLSSGPGYAGVFDRSANPLSCQTDKGCVSRYNIKNGNYISKLCINNTSDPSGSDDCSPTSLDIEFQRPNPDAVISVNGDQTISPNNMTYAIIVLHGTDASSTRMVEVHSDGLIEILPH